MSKIASPYDCLSNAIGLTMSDCECFDFDPEILQASESGVYMDKYIPLKELSKIKDCQGGVDGFWTSVKQDAICQVLTKLEQKISKRYSSARVGNSWVGQQKKKKSDNIGPYAGVCLTPKNGLEICINSIAICLDKSQPVTVMVMDDKGNILYNIGINSIAGEWASYPLEDPIVLPGNCSKYELVYYTGGAKPERNKFKCCGKKPDWLHCLDEKKTHGLTGQLGNLKKHSFASGLSLEVSCQCNYDRLFCPFQPHKNPLHKVLAYAIAYQAALCMLDDARLSSVCRSADVLENGPKLAYELNNRLDYLAEELPLDQVSCMSCKGGMQML